MDEKERAAIVAQHNDQFRQWWIKREGELPISGRALITQGIQELLLEAGKETQDLLNLIGIHTAFTEDNDPWGERDFAAFDFGGERLFWKIDLYSDELMQGGSEEPTNPSKTYRVLTIMLASEY